MRIITAPHNGGADAGADAGADTGTDAGADTGKDAGADVGTDTGGGTGPCANPSGAANATIDDTACGLDFLTGTTGNCTTSDLGYASGELNGGGEDAVIADLGIVSACTT